MNKIYCGDCVDITKVLGYDWCDLVITSPPYGEARQYKGFRWDFEKTARMLWCVVKQGGVVVWVVGDTVVDGSETGEPMRQALYFKEIGFRLHDTMIWRKTNHTPLNHNRYEQAWEYMFVFSKGKPKTFNPILTETITKTKAHRITYKDINKDIPFHNRDIYQSAKPTKIIDNVWEIGTSQTPYNHPAIFPIKIPLWHIKSWSNEDDVVFDPFSGSGTTGSAAVQLNRQFVLCEISEDYCKVAQERIKTETNFTPEIIFLDKES